MKQVINSKLYDTESAEELASYSNHKPKSDFDYVREVLYKTDAGQYFLHADGGAASKHAEKVGNLTTPNEELIPMSDEEALSWCEERQIDGEMVIEEFEDIIEKA